jgi:hypothetical protein
MISVTRMVVLLVVGVPAIFARLSAANGNSPLAATTGDHEIGVPPLDSTFALLGRPVYA